MFKTKGKFSSIQNEWEDDDDDDDDGGSGDDNKDDGDAVTIQYSNTQRTSQDLWGHLAKQLKRLLRVCVCECLAVCLRLLLPLSLPAPAPALKDKAQ